MNISATATRAQHRGIYHHLFELVIKVACIFATSALVFQAFSVYFEHLNELWQFHVSYSALILLESSLIVSWFALETQHEVPWVLKLLSAACLLCILSLIFIVSMMYLGGDNLELKALFLSIIFLRCLLSTLVPIRIRFRASARSVSRKVAIHQLKVENQKKQHVRVVNDMIDRALLKHKQKKALKEVEILKRQLIERAHAKHNLAMAQMNAKAHDLGQRYEDVLTSQTEFVMQDS